MKSGNNAGFAVFDHKEPILKGINCNCTYVQLKKIILNHSHYFWYRPRTSNKFLELELYGIGKRAMWLLRHRVLSHKRQKDFRLS